MKRTSVLIAFLWVMCTLAPSALWSQSNDDDLKKSGLRNSSESGASVKHQRRVALVIGNSDYKVGPLQNPVNDAEDISGVLRTLGFAVRTKTNVNHFEMEEAVNEFVQDIQNGDVALFYFSGHGVQVKGENYLIPVGAPIKSETDVRFKTLNANLVLGKMEESRNRTNIFILDACRNNPFRGLFRSASTGLSKMDAPKGTFIAYATSPNSLAEDGDGRNSPYTKHLIEALKMKNTPIEVAFKQVGKAVNRETAGEQTPWTSSSLFDDFYFYPESPTSSLAKPSDGGKTGSEQEARELEELKKRLEEVERERAKEKLERHPAETAPAKRPLPEKATRSSRTEQPFEQRQDQPAQPSVPAVRGPGSPRWIDNEGLTVRQPR